MNTYDVIVIGAGGMGAAAMYHLASRGVSVLGLDRFPPGHDLGSSHGQTRIIRQAYFEHSDYVPLLLRSYTLWNELEQQVGRTLYHQTGVVQIGHPHGEVVQGVLQAAKVHGLSVEQLTADEIESRWPMRAKFTGELAGVFEQQAGYLLVEPCVLAHLQAAQSAGAELQTGVTVHRWRSEGSAICVETDQGEFTAEKIVVTAGAWAGSLLAELGLPLEIRKKPLYWYACDDARYAANSGMPAFLYELPEGVFYGFPKIDDAGVKLARHSGGQLVADPLHVDRDFDEDDRRQVEAFAEQYMPEISKDLSQYVVCMYTMTPDEHFIIDQHPTESRIVLAAGMSGHGFKFSAVLGEVLADLALDGKTSLPIDFLSIARPALRSN